MDERLLEAFRGSTAATFRDMFGVEVKASAPTELAANDGHVWDITALVGLAGEVHGVLAIRLPASVVSALLEKSGVETNSEAELSAMQSGLVGEMSNIIAGSASSSAGGLEFEIAPPVVVRGPNHHIDWPNIGPVIAINFSTPVGPFELAACVKI
ncbi:MAG TPA: chemotaxis protein CheX [Rectinemataceae bacterium]|nr:chemotaxis protein CheX [Rectinemataceae bacterium]